MTEPESTLVVIDMQHIFRDPESQWAVHGYEQAAERVQQLVDAHTGPVVWTRFVRDEEEHGSWRQYYERWDRCRLASDAREWDLTLQTRPGDDVLTLPTFSKWGEGLVELASDGPLIVCGVATDCCVLGTVLGAVDTGRPVVVVEDACAGATAEAHEQAIALMGMLSPMVHVTQTHRLLAPTE